MIKIHHIQEVFKTAFNLWVEKKFGKTILHLKLIVFCFLITGGILFSITYINWQSLTSMVEQIAVLSTIGSAYFSSFAIVYGKNNQRNKEISENYHYKIQLLVNVESLLTSILQAQLQKIQTIRLPNRTNQEQVNNTVKAIFDDYQYWSSQIKLINGNVFAPAEIRSMVSLLIHQGVKPITSVDYSLDKQFIHNTIISYFDRIFLSNYFQKDKDRDVLHYLKMITDSKKNDIR